MTSITEASRVWQPIAATAAVMMVTVFLISLMPEICPAIDPAPASCRSDARGSTAVGVGLLVAVVATIGVVSTYAVPFRWRYRAMTTAMIAVVLAGVIAMIATLFASGFIVI